MRFSHLTAWLSATAAILPSSLAIELNISDPKSVESAASIAAANMLTYYNGTKPGYAPGILTNPYYWWEAGAMFGTMIAFWHLTGNESLNPLVMDGLLAQRGAGDNFEPANQTKDLGNDDQSFWAYAALDAAEFGFPNPPEGDPSWLSLAQAVFNRQIQRWDPMNCGGGLRWQIYQFNPGWNYKNTAANGGLFHIASRLARYTGNSTYADEAVRLWDWMTSVNFIIPASQGNYTNGRYKVIDGADIGDNCTDNIDAIQWTYNHGTVLMGAAYMYNYTNGSDLWTERLGRMVNGSSIFFIGQNNNNGDNAVPGTIMSEVACETLQPQTCKVDQPAFKSTLIRWLAVTTQIAPKFADQIYPWLNGSAMGAARQCSGNHGTTTINDPKPGGPTGNWCGRRWFQTTYDGFSGLGEQMSAMSAFQNVLIRSSNPPYTTVTGGNSTSDPGAGNAPTNPTIYAQVYTSELTRGDTAGAWILTALAMIIIGVGTVWMVREDDDWAGSGEHAGWMAPSAGSATYYRKTYGYGAYRLAGLQSGGVYKGKSSLAHNRFAKPSMPAMGLGSGGWWFGTGRGTGERWWEKDSERHRQEVAAAGGYPESNPRDSVVTEESDSTTKGFFSKFMRRGNETETVKAPKGMPTGGGWKQVGKGVFVRERQLEADKDESTDGGITAPAPTASNRQSRAPSRTQTRNESRPQSRVQTRNESRPQSRAQSRAQSIRKEKTMHWPT